jgi:hypothetical protein
MERKTIYLLGCSFTDSVKFYQSDFFKKFRDKYNVINLAYLSRSNFQILEDIKTLPNNSIAVIQWSALTRPDGNKDYDIDWNSELNKLAYSTEDPLKFLINNFIKVVSEGNEFINEKNIKAFQYIGWVQWQDSEIDEETNKLLKKLPINWFETPKLIDIIPSNCWEYNSTVLNNRIKTLLGGNSHKWEWKSFKWGGMSEWIRLNVTDMDKRYVATYKKDGYNDSHPSEYAAEQFYKNVILVEVEKLIKLNE